METGAENADLCAAQDLKDLLQGAQGHEPLLQSIRSRGAEDKATNSHLRNHRNHVDDDTMKFKVVKVQSFRYKDKRYGSRRDR